MEEITNFTWSYFVKFHLTRGKSFKIIEGTDSHDNIPDSNIKVLSRELQVKANSLQVKSMPEG